MSAALGSGGQAAPEANAASTAGVGAQKEGDVSRQNNQDQQTQFKSQQDALKKAAQLNQKDQLNGVPSAQQDQSLVRLAAQNTVDDKPISRDQMSQASNPDVRNQLLQVADADAARRQLQVDNSQILKNMAALGQVATAASGAATSMATAGSGSGSDGGVSVANSQGGTSGLAGSSGPDPAAASSGASASANAKSAQDAASLDSLLKKATSHGLRDALSKKLAAQDAAMSAQQFSGHLTSLGPVGLGHSGAPGDSSSSVFSAAAAEIRKSEKKDDDDSANFGNGIGGKSGGFAMRGSETQAEVDRMVSEGTRGLSSDGSVLEANSASLFERVSNAHKSCLKRKCVLGR